MQRTIAYIISRFPHLSETFILREMTEMEQHGWDVVLYPLILQQQSVIHADAQSWIPRARRLPYLSPGVMAANWRTLMLSSRLYGELWQRALWENRSSPNFFMRAVALFPQAVYAARLMQQEGVTHIHAHYATHPALVAWLIHHLTGISYSVTVHAHDIFVRTSMLATKLRDAAFIVAISAYNRDYLARVVGPWIEAKTHIVHCGIVPDNYHPRSGATRGAKRAECFEMLSIGSLQAYKGYPVLLRACALLRDRGIPFRCRIIGEGAERPKLERLIRADQLEAVVQLLGPQAQEDVARILPTAHCYVQPSIVTPSGKMEGIPVALMEALACRLPVVATSLSGIPELVRPNTTGYLVPPADASALADALAAVYADPEGADRLAQRGRAVVLREFELQTNVARLAALVELTVWDRQRQ